MPILEEHFYHKTVELYTAAFGSLFDSIKIRRDANKFIKVPIMYQNRDKALVHRIDSEDVRALSLQSQLPIISFGLTGFQRQPQRTTNKNQVLMGKNALGDNFKQFNRIAYDFQYELGIKTKNNSDMLQIIEQILVNFSDTVEFKIKDNPDLEQHSIIGVSLLSADANNQYEGIFEDGQVIETYLQFTLKGYLYKPTDSVKIITNIDVNYLDPNNSAIINRTDNYSGTPL